MLEQRNLYRRTVQWDYDPDHTLAFKTVPGRRQGPRRRYHGPTTSVNPGDLRYGPLAMEPGSGTERRGPERRRRFGLMQHRVPYPVKRRARWPRKTRYGGDRRRWWCKRQGDQHRGRRVIINFPLLSKYRRARLFPDRCGPGRRDWPAGNDGLLMRVDNLRPQGYTGTGMQDRGSNDGDS